MHGPMNIKNSSTCFRDSHVLHQELKQLQ